MSFAAETTRVCLVNYWEKSPTRLERLVSKLECDVTLINPNAPDAMFSMDPPDVVLIGFGAGSRKAAACITDYRSSAWFRRIPLIAVIESRDAALLELTMRWGCDDGITKPLNLHHLSSRIHTWALRYRSREKERHANDQMKRDKKRAEAFGQIIVPLGVAMMAETDFDILLDMILKEAMKFCHADAGTLYLVEEDHTLSFQIVSNNSLNLNYGGKDGAPVPFTPLPLHDTAEDLQDPKHIVTHVVRTGETINVPDAYADYKWDFSGTKNFDKATGYRTKSVLTIPLRNIHGSVIGALQLLNAMDPNTGHVVPFDGISETLTESLSILAAQAMESYRKMHQLRMHAEALTIEIDESEKQKQVEEITSSDYFKNLKAKATGLRKASRQKVSHPAL